MIPSEFDYVLADSVEHAITELASDPEAKLLAGGHSLIPIMKTRMGRPTKLIDVGRLGLAGVSDGGDHLVVGALTRQCDLERDPLTTAHCPIMAHAAGTVGDRQVRHRGTIGGSCAHGDPASDQPTIMRLLDATFVAQGPGGTRQIAAADFFKGFFETDLHHDEILTAIHVPKTGAAGWSYKKFLQRQLDWATVGVAVVVNGSARIAMTNMATTPFRASAAEGAFTSGGAAAASAKADEGADPPSDTWATADFRRHLSRVLTARALDEAGAK
ncbi:MAG TPA: xanthine dehydrogenase family protein subunit M [Miltoncostaeales bacterium]|nr:xanthine dehydrogenase family protein subunit M [Miltoncostaeales bacterium]